MKERHIILRSIGPSTGGAFGGPMTGPGAGPTAAPTAALAVEVEDIERRQLSAVARSGDVVAIAPAMPMKLVEPVEKKDAPAAAAATMAWGIKAVGADTSPFTGNGMVVAVLDTGIAKDHDAFKGVEVIEKDFTGSGNGDSHGHGTHCAGTILGRDVDNSRIGVARGVKKALIGKVLGGDGGGSDVVVAAMNWALENGANIISMSLGIDFPGFVEFLIQQRGFPPALATTRALEAYRQNVMLFERVSSMARALAQFRQTCLIVAAAGNESRRNQNPDFEIACAPPAVSEGNISVAAVGEGDGTGLTVAAFSNTGAVLSGPGVNILSAKPTPKNGLAIMSGTSMATPHVAGVAALWGEKLSTAGQLNPVNWSARLVASSVTTGMKSPFDPMDVGAGLVQAPQS